MEYRNDCELTRGSTATGSSEFRDVLEVALVNLLHHSTTMGLALSTSNQMSKPRQNLNVISNLVTCLAPSFGSRTGENPALLGSMGPNFT